MPQFNIHVRLQLLLIICIILTATIWVQMFIVKTISILVSNLAIFSFIAKLWSVCYDPDIVVDRGKHSIHDLNPHDDNTRGSSSHAKPKADHAILVQCPSGFLQASGSLFLF
jgi:hypothetical protein